MTPGESTTYNECKLAHQYDPHGVNIKLMIEIWRRTRIDLLAKLN